MSNPATITNKLESAIILNPLVVTPETKVIDAIAPMISVSANNYSDPHQDGRLSCVLIIESAKVVGIITERDVARIAMQMRSLETLTVREVMSSPLVTMRASEFTDLFSAVQVLKQHRIRHLPILDQDDQLLGFITHESLLQLARPDHYDNTGENLGMITDLSNCQLAEATLQESEERLRLALMAANQGLYDLNIQTGEAIVSPEYATMLGYDPSTFQETNARWIDRLHPDDQEIVANTYKDYVAGRRTEYKVEFRQRTQTGEWKWFLSLGKILEWDVSGNPLRMLGTHTDISDRKHSEAALAQLAAIVESSTDAIISKTLEGEIVSWNAGAERLFGYTATEIIGQSITLIIPIEFRNEEVYILGKIKHGEPISHYKTVRQHKDGRLIDISLTVSPIKDTSGAIIGASKIARDISELKQAEARLQQLNQELEAKVNERTQELWQVNSMQRAILDSADYSFISTDAIGLIQSFNPAAERMLGYSASEVIGKVTPAIFHDHQEIVDRAAVLSTELEQDIPVGFEVFVAKARLGIVSEEEWTYIRKDGSHFPVLLSVTAMRDVRQQIIGFLGIAKDISDRKRIEARLKRYENIISSTKDGIALLDHNYTYQIANQAYLSWCNKTYDEVVGASVRDILGSELFDTYIKPRLDHCLAGKTVQYEKWFDYPNIVPQFLSVTYTPYLDVNQTIAGIIVSLRDITKLKQAEMELQQTAAQLEASNQELEAFAYSVSHDLRAPLRAIDGFSNALIEDYGEQFGEEAKDYFDRIRRNVQRMGMLIDDLLRLSRVSRSEMQCCTVNLSNLVQEQVNELRESEPERQVEMAIAANIIVLADPTLMRVVISNLVQNAWKFTSHHATARIEFGVMQQDGQPTYFIRDDGAGFDMNYAKMLFRVFQRLHNTNEFNGTGIGLATVQRVIHRHGGQIWAEGIVEKGATIYFTVPNISINVGD